MERRWQVLDKSVVSSPQYQSKARYGAQQQSVAEILLKNRGIKDKETFFNPPKPDYLVTQLPNYLPDLDQNQLQRAVERIEVAISAGEKITVWGDYDVDGVTSTAILWQALDALGANALPYIPDRFTEGYGLNKGGIKRLSDQDIRLIITVDSGITARDEVEYANSLGLDVIVTDHHLKPAELPPTYAIVHTDGLCGAGIAWLLTSQLMANGSWLMAALDLVAIATIADLQPLLGANRSLVKYGFEVLNRNERPGLAALVEVAGLKPGNLGSYAAGWVLGPRINAIGRLGRPTGSSLAEGGGIEALRLLCTRDEAKARQLAHLLEAANVERRALTVETFNNAKDLITQLPDYPVNHLTVLYHDSWHEGIIGLVAGRLVEEYGRPAVVIAKGEEFSKGSARSVNGFNILEALREHSDLLEDVGGHEMAAGFTVLNEKLEQFVAALKAEAGKKLKELDLQPVLKVDLELPLQNLSFELLRELEKFKPYGVGNPEPLFVAREVNVLEERKVGRQKQHLKLLVSPGFEAIWFGHGDVPTGGRAPTGGRESSTKVGRSSTRSVGSGFTLGEEISLVYTPEIEVWDGKEKVTLKIRDLKKP